MAGVLRHPRRGFKMYCIYDKTVAGHCAQTKTRGSVYCYYHNKVINKLIEVDERASVLALPTMKL